jgi:hypothetical protein
MKRIKLSKILTSKVQINSLLNRKKRISKKESKDKSIKIQNGQKNILRDITCFM